MNDKNRKVRAFLTGLIVLVVVVPFLAGTKDLRLWIGVGVVMIVLICLRNGLFPIHRRTEMEWQWFILHTVESFGDGEIESRKVLDVLGKEALADEYDKVERLFFDCCFLLVRKSYSQGRCVGQWVRLTDDGRRFLFDYDDASRQRLQPTINGEGSKYEARCV